MGLQGILERLEERKIYFKQQLNKFERSRRQEIKAANIQWVLGRIHTSEWNNFNTRYNLQLKTVHLSINTGKDKGAPAEFKSPKRERADDRINTELQ